MTQDMTVIYREENLMSFRIALVIDDGHIVSLFLLPGQDSSIPNNGEYLGCEYTVLYRHKKSIFSRICSPKLGAISEDILRLSRSSCAHKGIRKWLGYWGVRAILVSQEKDIRPLALDETPEIKLLWADSGHSVALFLNGEPWAFIYQDKDGGYSKGVLGHKAGNPWNQALFESVFQMQSH